MRLIDADNLLTAFPPEEDETFHTSAVRGTINACPTVDAVPVVRCKGCRYWDVSPASTAAPAYHGCKAMWISTTADGFCSRGERKDGEH